ncbi:hypothetical protein EDC94DRAFT_82388 [Helicostylum pulchrum]|nr:hypothetical protein EDC94DRAFT_82388 [Helicostylum pulchrum]
MILTAFFVSELWVIWIIWICLYISCRLIIISNCRSNAPLPVPEMFENPGLPEMIAYDFVEIPDKFIFDRVGAANIFEIYLDELQMWIYLNRFRPLSCLKDNQTTPFFQQQTIKSLSQKILVELFSVDRDTRLKELLRYLCYNINEDGAEVVAEAITILISTYFGIKISIDGKNPFEEEVPLVFFRALCSSRNLFLCDFMLHHLTTSANADEIISKYDLNTLLSIDTSTEDTNIANLLNQKFMKPIEMKKPGFRKLFRKLFGGKNNPQLTTLEDHAENVLKDIRLFQTILTNLPEKNDDDSDNGNNNDDDDNNGIDDDNGDDDDANIPREEQGTNVLEEAPNDQENASMTFYPKEGESDYFDTIDEEQDTRDDEQGAQDEEQDIGDEEQGTQDDEQDIHYEDGHEEEHEDEEEYVGEDEVPERIRYSHVLSGTNEVSSSQKIEFTTYNHNIARSERRLSWPLVKSGSNILLRLVDDAGSAIADESELMRILRHHSVELTDNPGSPISEVVVSSLYHNNPSIRDFADAIIFRIQPGTTPISPPTPPIRYRSNSVYDQINFDKYGYPPLRSDEDVSDVYLSTSPLSNQDEESELNRDVPFVFNPDFTPSPVSEANDHTVTPNRDSTHQDESNTSLNTDRDESVSEVSDDMEIMSAASGEYVTGVEAGQIPSELVSMISNSANNTFSENAPSDPDSYLDTPPYTQSEINEINENVDRWRRRNLLDEGGVTDFPRVADINEEEKRRLEALGFEEYDIEGFGHFFFNLPQATFSNVRELRNIMDLVNQAFRNLTSNAYFGLFNEQLLLGDMSPESINVIEEVQMVYKEMTDQYTNYQRSFEEFEVGYTILSTIDSLACFKRHIRLLLLEVEEESSKTESTLNLSVFEGVYKTMCEGSQMAANLKRMWNTYVESSSSFKNVQKTYQKSIDAIEQDFTTIVEDFYILYEMYLSNDIIN